MAKICEVCYCTHWECTRFYTNQDGEQLCEDCFATLNDEAYGREATEEEYTLWIEENIKAVEEETRTTNHSH